MLEPCYVAILWTKSPHCMEEFFIHKSRKQTEHLCGHHVNAPKVFRWSNLESMETADCTAPTS